MRCDVTTDLPFNALYVFFVSCQRPPLSMNHVKSSRGTFLDSSTDSGCFSGLSSFVLQNKDAIININIY